MVPKEIKITKRTHPYSDGGGYPCPRSRVQTRTEFLTSRDTSHPHMASAVRAEHISKSYDNTVALDDVSLSVDHGEIFALVGPNGAGKTTLVRALTGTTTPDTGSVTVLDESPNQIEEERIGLLPSRSHHRNV